MTKARLRKTLCTAAALAGLWLCLHAAPGHTDQLVWQSSFEQGFPGGEWLDYDNGAYAPEGTLPAGRVSAWTIVHRQSGELVYTGNQACKRWITEAAGDSHLAYPVIHVDIVRCRWSTPSWSNSTPITSG